MSGTTTNSSRPLRIEDLIELSCVQKKSNDKNSNSKNTPKQNQKEYSHTQKIKP